jgi:endonuclease G
MEFRSFASILLGFFLLFSCTTESVVAQEPLPKYTSEGVYILDKGIYEVVYSADLEQPIGVLYTSTNRRKIVDRGSMNFHMEPYYHTSDDDDYYNNVWDKGHLAPAASFSDSYINLYETFSYLNCALQHQSLNRYQWNYLEQQERKWDDEQDLMVLVELEFSDSILPTGATIPSKFIKHIKFLRDELYKCYEFPNEKPTKPWQEYQVQHNHGN